MTVSVRFVLDQDNLPTASPPNFQTGNVLTGFRVYVSKSSSKFWGLTRAIVASDGEEMQIKDKLMVDVEIIVDGVWIAPT